MPVSSDESLLLTNLMRELREELAELYDCDKLVANVYHGAIMHGSTEEYEVQSYTMTVRGPNSILHIALLVKTNTIYCWRPESAIVPHWTWPDNWTSDGLVQKATGVFALEDPNAIERLFAYVAVKLTAPSEELADGDDVT